MSAVRRVIEQLNQVILGKDTQVKMALACLLARGHLLIEDLPGMGKTTLSHALASSLGLHYQRLQFTADLLPCDILGVSVFEREAGSELGRFRFHPGPVFSQVLLADEINRATPKAQSALLEAMEEGQVTVEGQTRLLPEPFFVIATQNPASQAGTYPLPESQLDRFLMRISLGYPDAKAERELLEGHNRRALAKAISACLSLNELTQLQEKVQQVQASPALLDYLQRVVAFTRNHVDLAYGLSPRGALALLLAAKAWALVAHERHYLTPDDIQAVLGAVIEHRLGVTSAFTVQLLASVPVLA